MIKTFEEFEEYYNKHGKTPNMLGKPKNHFNTKQLLTKWKSYNKANTKVENKVDEEWKEISKQVHARDKEECRLLAKLYYDNKEDYEYIVSSYPFTNILDVAHVIPRSSSKNLYYDLNNLVLLNRASHHLLDAYHHPVTGKPITKEQVKDWWIYIIGEENYNLLIERR